MQNPWAQLLSIEKLVAPSLPAELEDGVEWTANPSFELSPRIKGVIGADDLLPVSEGELVALVVPQLCPGSIEGPLGVENRPVKIEYKAGVHL